MRHIKLFKPYIPLACLFITACATVETTTELTQTYFSEKVFVAERSRVWEAAKRSVTGIGATLVSADGQNYVLMFQKTVPFNELPAYATMPTGLFIKKSTPLEVQVELQEASAQTRVMARPRYVIKGNGAFLLPQSYILASNGKLEKEFLDNLSKNLK
nr:hypothetical protein JG3_0140 [uncultured bacterium]